MKCSKQMKNKMHVEDNLEHGLFVCLLDGRHGALARQHLGGRLVVVHVIQHRLDVFALGPDLHLVVF